MLRIQLNNSVELTMDLENTQPGIHDGVAVLSTTSTTFGVPYRLVMNTDETVNIDPADILVGIENALVREGLALKVKRLNVASRV